MRAGSLFGTEATGPAAANPPANAALDFVVALQRALAACRPEQPGYPTRVRIEIEIGEPVPVSRGERPALGDEPPERELEARAVTEGSVFRRGDGHWTISHHGTLFRLKDSKGLRTIAQLLRHPGVERHVMELVALAEGASRHEIARPDPAELAAQGLRCGALGDAGELLDPRAKAAYRARLGELREELEEATTFNDLGRAERTRQEIDFLNEELSRAVGLGGRDRKAAAATERARLNVTRAIRNAIEKIAGLSPALHRHLSEAIRTGIYCCYEPAPEGSVAWAFDTE